MKKLMRWNYLFLTLAVLALSAALAALPVLQGETRAEPDATPGRWGEPATQTPAPTLEPVWAPQAVPQEPAARTENLYDVALTIAPRTATVNGKLRLQYVNTSQDVLYNLKLRLHANDVSPGCLTLESLAVNGERAYYELSGENGSILTLPLPLEIAPGESAELYLHFRIAVPVTGSRFGVNEAGLMLGNFLPIAAVYENGAWNTNPYVNVGDAFYSETADYRVAVTFPKTHALAHTGSLIEKTENYYDYTYYIAAARVRDFTLALIPEGKVATVQASVGRTAVHGIAATEGTAQFCAETGAYALDFFSRKIGLYPYTELFVVPFDLGGGMEYPGLVMVHARYLRSSYRDHGEFVIAHEVAHQWFYALVGSDQIGAPWLDEALAEFIAFRCYAELNGEDAAQALWDERYAGYAAAERTLPLTASLYEFAQSGEYFMTVYAHGAALYRALWEELGDAAFFGALGIYFDANSFKNATRADLLAAFEEATGRDLSAWFDARMAAGYKFANPQ